MPIRPELRHLYRGPAWLATRARILERAGNRCERCGKPNGEHLRVTRGGIWYDDAASGWRNDVITDGNGETRFTRAQMFNWIKAALDDELGIEREDGAAVTSEFVECVVRVKAV